MNISRGVDCGGHFPPYENTLCGTSLGLARHVSYIVGYMSILSILNLSALKIRDPLPVNHVINKSQAGWIRQHNGRLPVVLHSPINTFDCASMCGFAGICGIVTSNCALESPIADISEPVTTNHKKTGVRYYLCR